ncbi:NEDD4-binding protein 1 [Aphelenchoides besseyi]|nr:NEDD4-binding protein 1 [Aphelenchoides besseyi]
MSNERARERTEVDYDPSLFIYPAPDQISAFYTRRLLVIDGCNVLFDEKNHQTQKYLMKNATGLLWMVNYLMKNGFEVLVVLRRHFHDDFKLKNNYILNRLDQLEVLAYVGDNDDECILKTAKEYCGCVISNDQYRDHSNEYKEVIERRIGFRFLNSTEREHIPPEEMHLPKKSMGIRGSSVRSRQERLAYSNMSQPDYNKVRRIYQQISPTYFQKRVDEFNVMADYHQLHCCVVENVKRPIFDYFDSSRAPLRFEQFFEEYKRMQEYK